MSKVICDVCGTTYPETAAVCPICGCAKNTTEQTGADSTMQGDATAYNYVKGGRFSKSNVRKRNNSKPKETRRANDQKPENEGTNKGLVIVVLVLLLAIIAVLGYIGVRFLFPEGEPKPSETNPSQTQETEPSGSGVATNPEQIPCTEIKLSATNIELTTAGSVWMLSTEVQPKNTTDIVTFTSANPKIAAVEANGKITAVGGGETVITVTCGTMKAECKILCSFGEPVDPTTTPTDPPVNLPAGFVLKLNRKDFTLSKEGESWTLYKETDGVKASDITWTVDDPKVATVENGKVVGVNYGDTKVYATIGDQKVSCDVRVRFKVEEKDPEAPAKPKLNKTDVTIKVGETFTLVLTDSEGLKLNVEWKASEEGFVTIDGNKITGAAAGENGAVKAINVTGTYEEVEYTCIVRITEPKEEEKTE